MFRFSSCVRDKTTCKKILLSLFTLDIDHGQKNTFLRSKLSPFFFITQSRKWINESKNKCVFPTNYRLFGQTRVSAWAQVHRGESRFEGHPRVPRGQHRRRLPMAKGRKGNKQTTPSKLCTNQVVVEGEDKRSSRSSRFCSSSLYLRFASKKCAW